MNFIRFIRTTKSFVRRAAGIVLTPYESYRTLTDHGDTMELLYIGGLSAFYFAVASIVKTAAFRPYLLTRQFVILFSAAVATYVFIVMTLWALGRMFGGQGNLRTFALGWGYTLVPTTLWFFVTSLLYLILPPPRTTSVAGITFSLLYLMFTVTLFLWKFVLYYLTLRFGLKLDLSRIAGVSFVFVGILAVYSLLMYRLGIFRVPFL